MEPWSVGNYRCRVESADGGQSANATLFIRLDYDYFNIQVPISLLSYPIQRSEVSDTWVLRLIYPKVSEVQHFDRQGKPIPEQLPNPSMQQGINMQY